MRKPAITTSRLKLRRWRSEDLEPFAARILAVDHERAVDVLAPLHREMDPAFENDGPDPRDDGLADLVAAGLADAPTAHFATAATEDDEPTLGHGRDVEQLAHRLSRLLTHSVEVEFIGEGGCRGVVHPSSLRGRHRLRQGSTRETTFQTGKWSLR